MARRVVRGGLFGLAGAIGGCFLNDMYNQNERAYRKVVMPVVRRLLDAEDAHRFGVWAASMNLFPKSSHIPGPELSVKQWGIEFPNIVGCAAGFDKNGECIEGLARMGFGFVEIGSITPLPQEGNKTPRVFRLEPDMAVINRYGFNSVGHDVVLQNVVKYRKQTEQTPCVLGINLGKNKTSPSALEDYSNGVEKFAAVADYLVINISSPNTPGLRNLQARKMLDDLISGVIETRNKVCAEGRVVPLLLKIAPDLTDQDKKDIADVVVKRKIDGLIVSNTTVDRPESLQSVHCKETGGLSGRPLKHKSTQVVSDMYRLTNGKVPIIGVGGVENGQDAYDKIKAGASLVQVYSAITYQGPPLVKRVQRELEEIVKREGYSNVSEAVGSDHR